MKNQQLSPPTPWHLWVLGVLLLGWNGLAVFDYIATLIRYEPHLSGFPKEVLEYYFDAPAWMYAMWGTSSIGGFISAALLLLRRKLAVLVAGIAWVGSVAAAAYTYFNPPPVGGASITMYVIVLAVALLILLYLILLARRGVLR